MPDREPQQKQRDQINCHQINCHQIRRDSIYRVEKGHDLTADDIARQFARLLFEALSDEATSDRNGLLIAATEILKILDGTDPLMPTARRVAHRALHWIETGDPADYKKLKHAALVFARSVQTDLVV